MVGHADSTFLHKFSLWNQIGNFMAKKAMLRMGTYYDSSLGYNLNEPSPDREWGDPALDRSSNSRLLSLAFLNCFQHCSIFALCTPGGLWGTYMTRHSPLIRMSFSSPGFISCMTGC